MSTPPDAAQPQPTNRWCRVGTYCGAGGGVAVGLIQLGYWIADATALIPWPFYLWLTLACATLLVTSAIFWAGDRPTYADGYLDAMRAAGATRDARGGPVVQMPPRGSMRS